MPQRALNGIKVVEWAQLVAGPYCTKLLADLGAEVIKIEKPGVGDEARHRGPFSGDTPHLERSGLFLYLNTNKLGITLDIETTTGQRIFKELVEQADILVEDNPPRVVKELGLDYENLSRLNPRLVMTSITPFGQTGPYRDYKAYYFNTYHGGGLGYLTPWGLPPSHPPVKAGGFFGEYGCGLISALVTLAALYVQQITGLGQQVDISKQEAIMSLSRVTLGRYPNEGVIQSRFNMQKAYGDMFQCLDGHIVEMINEDYQWQALTELVGKPTQLRNEKYKLPSAREQDYEQIFSIISQWMMKHTKEEVYHQGQALSCPICPVMTAKDIVNSKQSEARGFFVEVNHPETGKLRYPAAPYHFTATPWAIERPAPLLGQHNDEVFSKRLGGTHQRGTVIKPGEELLQRQSQSLRGALEGIRIADFSWAWAGAHATELLAFLGAEVIKIESIKHLDHTRLRSFTTGQQFESPDQSYVFNDINLNKLSIRLNLKHPKGIALAKKLVSISDIVTQNMRPGAMERLGLGYEALRAVKPDIIYLSSSLRGSTGPEAGYVGYAPNFAALGGISYITGYKDTPPGYLTGEADMLSAVTSAFAILAALYHRWHTGEGQHIDLSSSEAISVLIGEVLMDYIMNGRIQSRNGNYDELTAPHNCYRCRGDDKWVSIAIATEEEWTALCQAIGNPRWSQEERFATAASRRQNREELDRLIEEWTAAHTHYQIMETLQQVGVAAVPCFNAEELFHDPHLNERGCWVKVNHPVVKELMVLAPLWKLSVTPARITRPAPRLGEHSHYVFEKLLGLGKDEIARLEEEQVIY